MGLDTAKFLLFLACVAVLQAWLPARGRVFLLLSASLAFYALSSIGYLVLLLALCALNYCALTGLSRTSEPRRRSWIFAAAILANLAMLVLFKYARDALGTGLGRLGWTGPGGEALSVAVPLGLSYISFQMMACVTDAYRQTWQLEGGYGQFAVFGMFFPQITSGPIPRAGSLLPQLSIGGSPTTEDRLVGMRMIAYGLFKKLVVANRLKEYVNPFFAGAPTGNSAATLLGCCFNALQLYADFSGYVDIAIGSARFLGIRLDPNFDRPYVSTSVTEFWRRWHMTLSLWLRDYFYMPLVIRIRALGKTGIALALIFTFAICGLWHGATWPFVLFGVAQGVAMTAEMLTKQWRGKRLKRMPKGLIIAAGSLYTLGFFVLSQVMFRSPNLNQARIIYGRLFQLNVSGGLGAYIGISHYPFAMGCAAIAAWMTVAWCSRRATERTTPWFVVLCACWILLLGALASGRFIYAAF
jgi:D-alanyl-lipoteichoic acid acyltransferase DltB (MBOAT superfamily)